MLKKFNSLCRIILEDTDAQLLPYEGIKLALVPLATSIPAKNAWKLVLDCAEKADKAVVILSDTSEESKKLRPLSMSSLREFCKLKAKISKENEDAEVKALFTEFEENAQDIGYNELSRIVEKLAKLLPDFSEKLQSCLRKIERNLSIDEEKAESSKMAAKLFKEYADAASLGDKIEIRFAQSGSPVKEVFSIVFKECRDCDVTVGVCSSKLAEAFSDLPNRNRQNRIEISRFDLKALDSNQSFGVR